MEVRVSKKSPVPNTQKMKKLEHLVTEKLWDKTRNLKMLEKNHSNPLLVTTYKGSKALHFLVLYNLRNQTQKIKNKKVQVIKEK